MTLEITESSHLALIVSVFGMVATVHLGVKSSLRRRAERINQDEESEDSNYNPYDLSDIPLSAREAHANIALVNRLKPLAQLLQPSEQSELNMLRMKLNYAGMRRAESLELFNSN